MTGMTLLTDHTSAHRVSREEFERLRDREDGLRYELLAGEVLVTPSPSFLHQHAIRRLMALLDPLLGEDEAMIPAPFSVVIEGVGEGDTVLEPDLTIADRARFGERSLTGGGRLVVEVLSPSTWRRDLGDKGRAYAAAGFEHYWVVSPTMPSLTVLRLGPDGVYQLVAEVVADESVSLSDPHELRISPADLIR